MNAPDKAIVYLTTDGMDMLDVRKLKITFELLNGNRWEWATKIGIGKQIADEVWSGSGDSFAAALADAIRNVKTLAPRLDDGWPQEVKDAFAGQAEAAANALKGDGAKLHSCVQHSVRRYGALLHRLNAEYWDSAGKANNKKKRRKLERRIGDVIGRLALLDGMLRGEGGAIEALSAGGEQ